MNRLPGLTGMSCKNMLIKTKVNLKDPIPTISVSQAIPPSNIQAMLLTLAVLMPC